jgi:hypothetical protein
MTEAAAFTLRAPSRSVGLKRLRACALAPAMWFARKIDRYGAGVIAPEPATPLPTTRK